MSKSRAVFWAIAERMADCKEVGRIIIVAESEACALQSGRWALIESLNSRYRSAEFTTRVELATGF